MVYSLLQTSLVGLLYLSAAVSAVPFSFPLANNFPNVTNPSSQLTLIEDSAHGSLPNGAPPPKISANTLTSLQLIAFNELFEVAFFTELIQNITNGADGYRIQDGMEKNFILQTLSAVQAQEELHELNANGAIAHFNHTRIEPCQYNFPVSNFEDAIALASTFTDVVIGTLGDVVSLFGEDGDNGLIKGVAAVIGQEGEQNGYYRTLQGKIPSALPFLTSSAREFAFSALNQNFAVNCPNANIIDLPVFKPLNVITAAEDAAAAQKIQFSVASADWAASKPKAVVFINQQNTPLSKDIENVSIKGNIVTFEASFPFNAGTFGNGLTIAAVTNSTAAFTSADEVAQATIFGPGLIEIN